MVSVSELRKTIFNYWQDMPKSGINFTVSHRRKIYKVSIEPTQEKLGGYKPRIKLGDIKKATCPKCGFMMMASVCLNGCTD